MSASRYSVFGLNIRSEIPLGELRPGAGAPDVEIRRGAVAAAEDLADGYAVTADGTLLDIPKVGRYLVREGREIVVDADPAVSERNLRLFLLGSAFGALLHQRGLLPLHANAIEIGGRAVAFCGHSGAGKSTIAAWFHDRGYRILSDDVCVVAFDAAGRALAQPGIPRLRLWREALEASGRRADEFARSFDEMDKYDVPTRAEAAPRAIPLDRVYLLGQASEGAAAGTIRRLSGVDAVEALVSNTYRGAYLRRIGRTGQHLMECLRLAKAVPVFSAERLWGYDRFEAQAEALERHACE